MWIVVQFGVPTREEEEEDHWRVLSGYLALPPRRVLNVLFLLTLIPQLLHGLNVAWTGGHIKQSSRNV